MLVVQVKSALRVTHGRAFLDLIFLMKVSLGNEKSFDKRNKSKTQIASSRIWTQVADSIAYDDNYYANRASIDNNLRFVIKSFGRTRCFIVNQRAKKKRKIDSRHKKQTNKQTKKENQNTNKKKKWKFLRRYFSAKLSKTKSVTVVQNRFRIHFESQPLNNPLMI